MREVGLLAASFAVSWLGFALLASSQAKYRKAMAVMRGPRRQLAIQRSAGGLLLLFALALTCLRDGPASAPCVVTGAASSDAHGERFPPQCGAEEMS